MAKQRAGFGTNLIKRASGDVTDQQRQYEDSEQARTDRAKADRDLERARIAEAEVSPLSLL